MSQTEIYALSVAFSISVVSKSVVDRKVNKQTKFTESETKKFVRSHDINAKNSIFWTLDEITPILEKDIMLGISAGAREKGKPRI